MKKTAFIFTILLIPALLGCNPFESLETKTQKLWNTNQKEAAINLLEKEIQSSPENVQAHMLLGEYYLKLEKYGEADPRFNAVMKLTKPGSIEQKNAQTKISQLYKEILLKKASENKLSYISVNNLLDRLRIYNLSVTTTEADSYLSKGAEKLWEDLDSAEAYFKLALFAGDNYQEKICDIILSEVKRLPIGRSENGRAAEISEFMMKKFHPTNELLKKTGLALLERAKESIKSRTPLMRTEYIASVILGEEIVNMELAPFDGRDIWINLEPNQEKIIGKLLNGDQIIYSSSKEFIINGEGEGETYSLKGYSDQKRTMHFKNAYGYHIITFKGGKEKTRINYKIITKK